MRGMVLFGLCGLVLATVSSSATANESAASLQGLGFLPSGANSPSSWATSVSGDGTLVTGGCSAAAPHGWQTWKWTASTGIVGLGYPNGSDEGTFNAHISKDGSTITGTTGCGNSLAPGNETWRKVGASWMDVLNTGGDPYAIDGDGNVIVGRCSNGPMPGYPEQTSTEAWIWRESSGKQLLGFFSQAHPVSQASGVSADGERVVGSSMYGTSNNSEAFLWTELSGLQHLGFLAGGSYSAASAISADGQTILGFARNSSGDDLAFRWRQSEGMVDLGAGWNSYALAASFDGSRIVGRRGSGAFIWDAEHGARDLSVALASDGLDMTGWTLLEATSVSNDGTVIVGYGIHNGSSEAFRAVLPVPEPAAISMLTVGGLSLLRRRRR